MIAQVVVSAATWLIDKPYDYEIPECLYGKVLPGMRVKVPFSGSNRISDGVVIALKEHSDFDTIKLLDSVVDDIPSFDANQLQLAVFMRDRYFCTVFDALRCMLPASMWCTKSGRSSVKDHTEEYAALSVSIEEALAYISAHPRAEKQVRILENLSGYSSIHVKELLNICQADRSSLRSLISKGLIHTEHRLNYRTPWTVSASRNFPILSAEQNQALCSIMDAFQKNSSPFSLLLGVTGSGKTSVYIHLIREFLQKHQSCILLVPEISLTPQMIQLFSSFFGNNIALMHSSLTKGERLDEWKRAKNGDARLVIGTRSAVFAPVRDLGLIILDEEQDSSYHSESSPRYDTHAIAGFIAEKNNAHVLLGSATPDVRTMYLACNGRIPLIRLNCRFNSKPLPKVIISDMKKDFVSETPSIGSLLICELQKNIEKGEQSILFLNRRGSHRLVLCSRCGSNFKCPRCSVNLTFHAHRNLLLCHYCGHSERVPISCPFCGGPLLYYGSGTQQVEQEIHNLFPDVPTIRVDTDSVTESGGHEVLFQKFRDQRIPIMIGTQMVTKGLNFENVTLVGVVSADQSLCSSSYRASEETFSLLTQVIGRSGRGTRPGRAVIQTFSPENEVILLSAKQDYDSFYRTEIALRSLQQTPPFLDIVSIIVSGKQETLVLDAGQTVCQYLNHEFSGLPYRVLGPVPLAIAKVNDVFRYRICICGQNRSSSRRILSYVLSKMMKDKRYKKLTFYIDTNQ